VLPDIRAARERVRRVVDTTPLVCLNAPDAPTEIYFELEACGRREMSWSYHGKRTIRFVASGASGGNPVEVQVLSWAPEWYAAIGFNPTSTNTPARVSVTTSSRL